MDVLCALVALGHIFEVTRSCEA